MKDMGIVLIAVAIILIFISIILAVENYFGEVWAFSTFIIELVIIGVLLIKLEDRI